VQPFAIFDGWAGMADEERLADLARRLEAQGYRDRAAENLKLAENAQSPDVRERYLKIAQHYLELAEVQEQSAKQTAGRPGDH
jgi:t-SNARE complex subunit (syntaxin)